MASDTSKGFGSIAGDPSYTLKGVEAESGINAMRPPESRAAYMLLMLAVLMPSTSCSSWLTNHLTPERGNLSLNGRSRGGPRELVGNVQHNTAGTTAVRRRFCLVAVAWTQAAPILQGRLPLWRLSMKGFEDELHFVDPSSIKQAPIRHEELSPELLTQLEQIYRDAAHYIWDTLETWEVGFMYDMHPESEAGMWRKIADVFLLYCERHVNGRQLTRDEGAALVNAVIGISTGAGLVTNVRDLNCVDKYVGRRLVKCWQSLYGSSFKPITVAKSR